MISGGDNQQVRGLLMVRRFLSALLASLLFVGLVPVGPVLAQAVGSYSTSSQIASGTDDAEESATGKIGIGSSDLELVQESSTQTVGLRFTELRVPAGAVITSAYIQFRSDEIHTGATSLLINVEASDDAQTFVSTNGNISSRPLAPTSALWEPAPWSATKLAGPDQATSDLSAVLQHVIDRAGWQAGNAVAFVITGSGKRVADSYEGGRDSAAILHVEYGAGSGDLPPVVHVTGDSAFSGSSVTLQGAVVDEGPTSPTTTWSKVTGPGSVAFADASALSTTATFSVPGEYVLQLTADDGQYLAADTVPVAAVSAGQASVSQFAVVGDFGEGSVLTKRVFDLLDGFGPDFIVTVGDNSYGPSGQERNVARDYSPYIGNYQGAYGEGSGPNRFFPALGNHDVEDGEGLVEYLDFYTLPGGGVETSNTSGNERYYDFVQGPVHFFILNSYPTEPDGLGAGSVQQQWLQTQLAASTSDWNVVVSHDPPYASSGVASWMRWPYKDWGADIVLSGDQHYYERLTVDGLPYIVNGLGGVSRKSQPSSLSSASDFFFTGDDGGLLVNACAEAITFDFHAVGSGLVDSLTLGGACGVVTNSAPDAVDDNAQTLEDTPVIVPVLDNDTDVDLNLDPSTVSVTVAATNGLAAANPDGTVTYSPAASYNGGDAFIYEVCDTEGLCDSANVTVSVGAIDEPPTATDVNAATDEDVATTWTPAVSDPDSVTLTCAIAGQPTNGSASVTADCSSGTYQPDANFNGADAFFYNVTDGFSIDVASVAVAVAPIADSPQPADDQVDLASGTTIQVDVTMNDVDVDGDLDATSVTVVAPPPMAQRWYRMASSPSSPKLATPGPTHLRIRCVTSRCCVRRRC